MRYQKQPIKPLIASVCFVPLMAGAGNSDDVQLARFSDVKAVTQVTLEQESTDKEVDAKTALKVHLLNSTKDTDTVADKPNTQLTDESTDAASDTSKAPNNHCQLVLEGYQPFTLALEKDCYFFADAESGKAFTYAYPDVQVQSVLLIGGTKSPLTMDERKHRKLSIDNYCTDQIQALLLTDEGYALTQVQQDTPACVGDKLDEKVYYTMARFERMDAAFSKVVDVTSRDNHEATEAGSDSAVTDEETNLFDKIKAEIENLFK